MSVTIALAGDTMLGRGVGAEIAKAGTRRLYSCQVRERVASADLVVLNLECCISDRGDPWDRPTKLFHLRAPPQAADALADLGGSCVTLADNHALDFGYTALTDTIGHLSGAGILVAGAGADVHRARAPVVLEACGLTVAVLGVTDHPADFAATADRPGVSYPRDCRGRCRIAGSAGPDTG
jgi:poly-gamma-glutamate capsule biosynthesis protein CapA/YwtB (metallophosphatase superfamily)